MAAASGEGVEAAASSGGAASGKKGLEEARRVSGQGDLLVDVDEGDNAGDEDGDGVDEDGCSELVGTGRVWEAREAVQRARFLLSAVAAFPLDAAARAELRRRTAAAARVLRRVERILAVQRRRDRAVPLRIEYPVGPGPLRLRCSEPVPPLVPRVNGRRPGHRRWQVGPGGPLRFAAAPALLDGLALDPATGAISGRPAVPGGGRFTVTCQNAMGQARSALTVCVEPDGPVYGPAGLPSASLPLMPRLARLQAEGRDAEAAAEERRERRARIRRYLGPYPVGYSGPDRRQRGIKRQDSEYVGRVRLQAAFRDYALY
jgi:hypothetical protein